MNNQTSARVNPFALGVGLVSCLLGLLLLWVALDLPGVSGGSGSIWEKGMVVSFMLASLCVGLQMLGFALFGERWRTSFSVITFFGALVGFGGMLWTTYERAKEVGMILPF